MRSIQIELIAYREAYGKYLVLKGDAVVALQIIYIIVGIGASDGNEECQGELTFAGFA